MNIYFVRHGHTPLNDEQTVFSRRDSDLDETGMVQAHLVANFFREYSIKGIYTSPAKRALETARIIALDHDIEVQIDERLMELDCGTAEGMLMQDFAKDYPEIYRLWKERPSVARWPGGETLLEASNRVISLIEQIKSLYSQDENVIFVGHAMIFKAAIARLVGAGVDSFRSFAMAPGSISLLKFDERGIRIEYLNYVPEV